MLLISQSLHLVTLTMREIEKLNKLSLKHSDPTAGTVGVVAASFAEVLALESTFSMKWKFDKMEICPKIYKT